MLRKTVTGLTLLLVRDDMHFPVHLVFSINFWGLWSIVELLKVTVSRSNALTETTLTIEKTSHLLTLYWNL